MHGLGGTPVEFRFVADGLAAAGHTVSVPLLYGHGGSDRLLNTTTWNDWYGTVQEAHDKLKAKCDVVVAGGLSVGVLLALHLACERPRDVHALVLFSPTFWPNGWAIPKAFHLFRLFVRFKWLANLFHLHEVPPYGIKDERIRRFVLDSLQNDADKRSLDDIFGRRGGTILEFRWLADKVRRELGQIRQPALIFHPRTDDQSDLSNTILLQRKPRRSCPDHGVERQLPHGHSRPAARAGGSPRHRIRRRAPDEAAGASSRSRVPPGEWKA